MQDVDVLIRHGQIIDGTGNPWFYGDVALTGERIAAIAPPGQLPAERVGEVIDAAGHVVCPGFIDIQSHAIVSLMRDGRCVSKIAQGVTTEIMGETWTPAPVGGRLGVPLAERGAGETAEPTDEWLERSRGWTRFGDWLEAMTERGVAPNVGSFLAGSVVRRHAMGMAMGSPDHQQLDVMRRVMAEAMADGAFDVSYALIYPPDVYTDTDEIVEVCKVVAEHGGLYITHMRSEGTAILEALDEALAIGHGAGLPVEIYHLKASGRPSWPLMPEVIGRIDAARAAGQDVTACMYPYVASGTGLTTILPTWAAEGGRLFERLADAAERARIREAMLESSQEYRATPEGAREIMPVGLKLPQHRRYVGMRLDAIAEARGQAPADAALDLLAAEGQRIFTLYFRMTEENLRRQIVKPWVKIASDAGVFDPATVADGDLTHPRAYGTVPRVLGHYVRDAGVLTLEDAVRKMTSSVAARLGIADRGTLRVGAMADVVIFDPASVADNATFDRPHQLASGIRDVWVNGQRVWHDGNHTGATPGQVVRPSSPAAAMA